MEEDGMEEKEAIKMLEDIVRNNPINLGKIEPFMYEILYLLQSKDKEIKELKEINKMLKSNFIIAVNRIEENFNELKGDD